jgi:hypothetical protein
MNEAYVVRKIITQIKRHVPQAAVLKINDRSTSGIPDISIDYGGTHIWVEVKLLKEHETKKSFEKHIDKLQLASCELLDRQGECTYFLAYPSKAFLVLPSLLSLFIKTATSFDMSNLNSFSGILCAGNFNKVVDELIASIKEDV